MSEEVKTPVNPRDALKLKLPEPDVSAEQPWDDDVLGRAEIAGRLTNLIRNQSAPFVISIHGHWGTGKTFLLKRWQRGLEQQNFRAIYFNAWEDDFCDDPLLSILGQMSNYFKEARFEALARRAANVAVPLIRENLLGVVKATTGLTLKVDHQEQGQKTSLDTYLEQRATKDELKSQLAKLSEKVVVDTSHPMVFIIDELDRCRPTFAIELLERVKHIFDVPNLVFIFGVNRDELCKSLQSIYGEIDSDVYLRRFFDMEFTLPEVDSEKFGGYLMQKYGLSEFFSARSQNANSWVHAQEFGVLWSYLPALWVRLGLLLRDIDYCVRSIALVGRNLEPRNYMYPWLLGLLITLKLKNSTLYRQFIQGNCLGSEVMNYIDGIPPLQERNSRSVHALAAIEAYLYRVESGYGDFESKTPTALSQLKLLKDGEALTNPEYLSKKTKEEGAQRAGRLIEIIQNERNWNLSANLVRSYLPGLIDLQQDMVRR